MPQDSPSRHLDQFLVRFPDGMRDRIAEVAKANGRSMNAEIVHRLGESLIGSDLRDTMSGLPKDRLIMAMSILQSLIQEEDA